jgi:hypothetical protein
LVGDEIVMCASEKVVARVRYLASGAVPDSVHTTGVPGSGTSSDAYRVSRSPSSRLGNLFTAVKWPTKDWRRERRGGGAPHLDG